MKKLLYILSMTVCLMMTDIAWSKSAILIQTGDISFATLNTMVSNTQTHQLVDATITQGEWQGATLHGELIASKNKDFDSDKISLQFTSMEIPGHANPLKITAYAIDSDTARTVLKTKISPNYWRRNGVTLAVSFIQSYSQNNPALNGRSQNPNAPMKIKINAGTQMGILFID